MSGFQNKIRQIAKDTDKYLHQYFKNQDAKSYLLKSMKYGLFSGGKGFRSKIIFDTGKIFNIDYNLLKALSAAVECVHSYSLIHDDLPCMDDDDIRRGKLSTHKKFGESTAILAGNSLLTIAFQILSQKNLWLNDKIKIKLINLISECSGHSGIAGGQYSDLNFERKKIPFNKIIKMQVKKTGKLFSFCCMAPVIISKKVNYLDKFNKIGSDIGLLFQIVDDLIDYSGKTRNVGKKTKKDLKHGKATLISLLGHKNTIIYANKLKLNIYKKLHIFGNKVEDLRNTIEYILSRSK